MAGEPESSTPVRHLGSSSPSAVALPVAALLVAVAALGLSGWMWFHPRSSIASQPNTGTAADQFFGGSVGPQPPSNPSDAYTDTQRADAKSKVCTAYTTVDQGIGRNTNLAPELQDTAVGSLAVAANWRVAVYNGGQYLLARVDPATPPDLADAIRSLASLLMDIGAAATAGVDNSEPAQTARIQEVGQVEAAIVELCK